MKNTNTLTTRKIWIISQLIIIILGASSCNKESSDLQYNDGNLEIKISGIEEYIDVDKIKKQSSNTLQYNTNNITLTSYAGFDAITSIAVEEPLENLKVNKEASIPSNLKKLATTNKMDSTVEYRLIIYKADNNEIAYNEKLLAKDKPRIRLASGQYRYAAYSTNESSVPAMVNNIIPKSLLVNKDFLFVSNSLTVGQGDNFLNLTFKRYTTKYDLTIDVRGMFATINDATKVYLTTETGDLLQTANFNLLTGEFEGGTFNNVTISGSELQQATFILDSNKDTIYLTPKNDVKKISFYSVTSTKVSPENKMKVEFAPLNIKMDDGLDRNFTLTAVNLNNPDIVGPSTRGRKYTINATLVESPVKIKKDNDSTLWARSNLWYNDTNLSNSRGYRFRVSPHQRDNEKSAGLITDLKDLWKFNTSTPNGSTQTNGFDPCTSVYPNNLWKMPSENDFLLLGTSGAYANSYAVNRNDAITGLIIPVDILGIGLVKVDLEVGTNSYLELSSKWNRSNTSNSNSVYDIPYNSNSSETIMNDLFLSGVGYKNTSGIITNRPVIRKVLDLSAGVDVLADLLDVGLFEGFSGNGYYWTSKGINTSGVLANPSYFTFSNNATSVLNLDALGLNLLSLLPSGGFASSIGTMAWNNAMNIRCVRNKNYPNAPSY